MSRATDSPTQRRKLLKEIERLAEVAIFGTLSETYRTCGRDGCHCQQGDRSTVRTSTSAITGSKARRQVITFLRGQKRPHAKAWRPGRNCRRVYGNWRN